MRVRRYRSLLAMVLVLLATGVATSSTPVIIAGTIPLAFVLQGALGRTPSIEDGLYVERTINPESPLPGQSVEVTLTVENVSDAVFPDIRVVDGVPSKLGVATGSARSGGALRPGARLSTTYSIVANRGTYEFDDVSVRCRNIGGTRMVDRAVTASGDGSFECRVSVEDVPFVQNTTAYAGPLATDTGGHGIEFYATRDYRPGDSTTRINWRRYAKTGELSTVEYREQRAANVVVVVDSRSVAHVSSAVSEPTGATLCAYSATLAVGVLTEQGHHVALAGLGMVDPISKAGPPAWVGADAGKSFSARAAAVCNAAATGPDQSVAASARSRKATTDGGIDESERLLSLLPAGAEVLLCTPATDDGVLELVESLMAAGHATTVLSPQTAADTVGGRIEHLNRATRLERIRMREGTSVVDWDRKDQLPIAIARSLGTEVR